MNVRTLSVTIALLLGFLYSSMLVLKTKHIANSSHIDVQRPDAFIEDVVALDMDKNGKLHSKLISPKITHYALNNTSLIIDPHFIVYSETQTPWHTTSEFAKAINGTEELYLWSQVKIQQESGAHNKGMLMTTDELTFQVNQNFAHTKSPVYFSSPGTKVSGIGMNAFLNEKRVILLSNTRGIHEKNLS